MSKVTCSPVCISLQNVPAGFGLVESKRLIMKHLNDENIDISPYYYKNADGEVVKSTIIIQFKDTFCASELLKTPFIEVEHNDELHRILITKPRSRISSHTVQKEGATSFQKDDFGACANEYNHLQRSLFCTRIPSDMYNGRDLRCHFNRFGDVDKVFFPPKNKTYAIVYFYDHSAASEALKFGEKIESRNCHMRIKWNRDERTFHQPCDKPAPRGAFPAHPNPRVQARYKDHTRPGGQYRSNDQRGFSDKPVSNVRITKRGPSGESRSAAILNLIPMNWNQILEKEKDIFHHPYKRCVLVHNLPNRIPGESLCSYFENLSHCGGRVVSMKRILDGILVEFEDEETAESILVNEHKIDSVSLEIFPKTIPPIYDNCFVVEGNFENDDALKSWLECGYSSNVFSVECHSENAIYLIRFSVPIDFEELISFAKRVSLPRIKPKIRELTRPDCVIVNDLSADINDDIIKLTFMNTTKSGGGQVTMIKRKPGSSSAFVYFSHWQDAENVVKKSNRLQIRSTEVKVCLWYNHVSRVSSKQNIGRNPPRTPTKISDPIRSPARTFELNVKCDGDVIEYIKNSSNFMENLVYEMEEIALIDFLDSTKPKVRFKPNFRKTNRRLNQVAFEEDCMKLFENFLAKFSTLSKTFDVANLSKLRKCHIWTESAGIIQVEVDENVEAIQVFARWNSPSQGGAKITGAVHEVPEVMKWLKKKCDVSREKVSFTPEDFQSFSSFEMLNELMDFFRADDIRINLDETSNSLLLEGSSDLVKHATEYIKKSLEKVGTSLLLFLHQQLFDFLRDIYAHPTTNNVQITDAIQRQLQLKNVKAYFRVQPTFVLVYYQPRDLNAVRQILSEYTARKEVKVERDFNQITQSLEWKRLEQNIDENLKEKVRLLKDKQSSKIVLVGVETSVNAANQEITKHLKDNIVEKRKIKLKPGFDRFLRDLHEHIKASLHLAHVKWEVHSGMQSEISLEGKCFDLDKAEKWLNNQQETIKMKSIQITEPGMSEYFQNCKGTEFLQAIQALSKCVIWVSSSNTSSRSPSTSQASNIQNMMILRESEFHEKAMVEWFQNRPQTLKQNTSQIFRGYCQFRYSFDHRLGVKYDSKSGKVLFSETLPEKNVTIHVVQDDITDLSCDAIVNTSNEELTLKNVGISGAILRKGGGLIELEMVALRKSHGGKLSVGVAVSTSSANLPCKRVIHVVGPMWNRTDAKEARVKLRNSVYACLKECETYNLKSIAIPAISCDEFGGNAKDCIPEIVRAVKRYFTHKVANSLVEEIIFVEKNVDEIIEEFAVEVRKSIAPDIADKISDCSASIKASPVSTSFSSPVVQSLISEYTPRSSQPPIVTLMLGDIADMTADVLVTSCSSQSFSSCAGSATSRALLAKAGSGLLKECQQQDNPSSAFFKLFEFSSWQVFDIKRTAGYFLQCKEVFHILLEEYSSTATNASQLVAAIQKCLQAADDKGYSRIVFPAIGTGGMKYPYDKLATWFKQEFSSFQGSNLKNIDIVLYPSDSSAIAAFSKVFAVNISVQSDARFIPTRKIATPIKSGHASNLTVVVKQGDILSTTCDVMVCPTATKYDLSKGKMSKTVIARAGSSVVHQCQNPSRLYTDDKYRVTDGGHLSCKRIVFVPPPNHTDDVFDILCQILYCADQSSPIMQSIVFPTLFTGNIGFSSSVVAQEMARAIERCSLVNLQKIEVIILEPAKLPVFQSALAKFAVDSSLSNTASADAFYSSEQEDNTATPRSVVSLIPTQSSSKSSSSVKISLCSNTDKNIEQAEKQIRKEVEEKSLTKTIENDVIAKLTNGEEKEILEIGKKYGVSVLKKKSKCTELVVSGLKDDVYKVSDSVANILLDFKAAITCAEYVTWKFKDQNFSHFTDFPLRASAKLEALFKENKNGNVPVELQLRDRIASCTLDFGSMFAVSSTEQLQLVRSLKASASGDDLPSYWTAMGNDQWKLVTLLSTSDEYVNVFKKFQIFGSNVHSYSSIQTVKIGRIQNPTLYKQFVAQKRKVETRMKQRGGQHPVTRELFHGTSADVCDNICKDGFDRSHCGKNATAYGRGVYFATTANYSQGYARSDSEGRRHMFLADVITGEYCQGDKSYKVPPLFPGSDSQRYDSVVNNEQTPTMFVVFKDASVYPLYIATYVYN